MDTLTRKQREIREREQLILDVARDMLLTRAYLGVTMDRIAQEIEYSNGTVYQHFSNKEDVLVASAGGVAGATLLALYFVPAAWILMRRGAARKVVAEPAMLPVAALTGAPTLSA